MLNTVQYNSMAWLSQVPAGLLTVAMMQPPERLKAFCYASTSASVGWQCWVVHGGIQGVTLLGCCFWPAGCGKPGVRCVRGSAGHGCAGQDRSKCSVRRAVPCGWHGACSHHLPCHGGGWATRGTTPNTQKLTDTCRVTTRTRTRHTRVPVSSSTWICACKGR